MIEDPKFTLKLLQFFAQENIPWPANLTVTEVQQHFATQSIGRDKVEYHLICAIELKLLHGFYNRTSTFDGAVYTFSYIDGLTVEGSNYVINASKSKLWEKAMQKLLEQGFEVTTKNVLLTIQSLIQ